MQRYLINTNWASTSTPSQLLANAALCNEYCPITLKALSSGFLTAMGSVSKEKLRSQLPRGAQSKANGNIPVDFTTEVMRSLIISDAVNARYQWS